MLSTTRWCLNEGSMSSSTLGSGPIPTFVRLMQKTRILRPPRRRQTIPEQFIVSSGYIVGATIGNRFPRRRRLHCQSLVSYVGAYDDVSTAAAIRKFGHDVFKESAVEARTSLGAHSSNHEEDKGRSKTTISVTFSGGLRLFALLQPADLLRETRLLTLTRSSTITESGLHNRLRSPTRSLRRL
jgi:hypothetical protein